MPADRPAPAGAERELEAAGARPRRRRFHPLALASLVLGFFALVPPAALGALLAGLWARRAVRLSQGRSRGRTVALVGAALGTLGLAVQAVSAVKMAALYREVTPVATELLRLLDDGKWYETYHLFEPTRPVRVPPDRHEAAMRRLVGAADGFEGMRWAYRLRLFDRPAGPDRISITYDARFRVGRGRYTFDFVRTRGGWRIERVSRIE